MDGDAPLAPITDNAFVHTTWTTSHGILVANQPATAAVTPGPLPSNGLGMTTVYVTDGTAGTLIDNRYHHGCKAFFVIRRQTKPIFLIPFVSLHTTNQAGIALSIFGAMVQPFASLFSLITGGPLSAGAASRISNFGTVETAFNTILGKLNNDFNYAASTQLGVGTTTIRTNQSVATVTVRPVNNLIGDKIDDFSNDLRALGDSEKAQVADATPDASCRVVASSVAEDGITAAEDRAYILGYEGLKLLTSKINLEHCFGTLVKVAAALPQIWPGQDTMRITPEQAAAFYDNNFAGPQQLPFSEIKSTLDHLMTALGQYSLNGKPSAQHTTNLTSLFVTSGATLTDNSIKGIFKSATIPTGVPAVVDFLISQGYYHYGCFAQSTDQTGQFSDNANSIFLAFKAPPEADSVKRADKDSIIAIHPIFADGLYKVQAFDISDNPDWITGVLSGRTATPPTVSDCNGFNVQ